MTSRAPPEAHDQTQPGICSRPLLFSILDLRRLDSVWGSWDEGGMGEGVVYKY